MSNEEAIATLRTVGKRVEDLIQSRAENGFPPNESQLEYIDALDMAIEALEKQIPKKPLINGDINPAWHKEAHICPKCFNYVGWCNYCSHCGQAIDLGVKK